MGMFNRLSAGYHLDLGNHHHYNHQFYPSVGEASGTRALTSTAGGTRGVVARVVPRAALSTRGNWTAGGTAPGRPCLARGLNLGGALVKGPIRYGTAAGGIVPAAGVFLVVGLPVGTIPIAGRTIFRAGAKGRVAVMRGGTLAGGEVSPAPPNNLTSIWAAEARWSGLTMPISRMADMMSADAAFEMASLISPIV